MKGAHSFAAGRSIVLSNYQPTSLRVLEPMNHMRVFQSVPTTILAKKGS